MLSRIARSGKTRFESYVCGKKHIHQHNTRREVQSYVHGACNVPLMFSTTGEVLRKQAESRPDKEFLVFRDQNVRKTFANVYEDARRLAAGFLSLGLQKGDRVGVWGHNYYEWTMVQYATAIAGMIQVNINPSYTSSELLYALQKVGVKALVTPKSFKQNDYYSSLMEICPTMARGEPGNGAVSHRELPDLKHIIVFGEEEPLKGAWAFNEILNGGGSEGMKMLGEVEWTVLPDDPVNIQYTSGTTGYPKAATLTHHNILNNAYHAGIRSKFDQQEHKICVPNPLYHCFGCVLGVTNALTHAQTCVFPAVNYQIKRVFEAIQEEKCTFLFGTPTMFIDLLSSANFKDYDLSSLKGGYIAGAPCPPALCEAMVRDLSMDDMYILYGSTECSPLVTMSVSEEPPMERIKSVGNVMPHVEAMVVDPEGKCVDRGVRGELWARGYMTMRGYWADEEKTKKDLTADHWYHSGIPLEKPGSSLSLRQNSTVLLADRCRSHFYSSVHPYSSYTHPRRLIDDVIFDKWPEEVDCRHLRHVIYYILAGNTVYIGQTRNCLCDRIRNHISSGVILRMRRTFPCSTPIHVGVLLHLEQKTARLLVESWIIRHRAIFFPDKKCINIHHNPTRTKPY